MVKTKFDKAFYVEVDKVFNSDTDEVIKLIADSHDGAWIGSDFPIFLHTVISNLCIFNDDWKHI